MKASALPVCEACDALLGLVQPVHRRTSLTFPLRWRGPAGGLCQVPPLRLSRQPLEPDGPGRVSTWKPGPFRWSVTWNKVDGGVRLLQAMRMLAGARADALTALCRYCRAGARLLGYRTLYLSTVSVR